jgi:DNA repair protein RadC
LKSNNTIFSEIQRDQAGALTALSCPQLISLLLGVDQETASGITNRFPELRQSAALSADDLAKAAGLSLRRSILLQAAIELGSRALRPRRPVKRIASPADIHELLADEMDGLRQESFCVIMLSTKNDVLSREYVSIGLLNSSLVHSREVFRKAILVNAYAVILAHNHPSGDPTPSESDRDATEYLERAGELLGIKVLDHVIIGQDRFYSFKESGIKWVH